MRLHLKHGHIAYAHDIVMAALSFALSLYLRVGAETFTFYAGILEYGTLLIAAIAAAVFWSLRLYRGIWRYASVNDLLALTRAATVIILIFLPALFLLTRAGDLPRSVPVINWFLLLFLIGGPRFVYRILKDRRLGLRRPHDPQSIPVLLVGAGDAAELFIRAAHGGRTQLYRAVGMVAESDGRVGRNIHGVDVLGTFDDIPAIVERLKNAGDAPQRLILTLDGLDGAIIRHLVDTADSLGMTVARLPRIVDFQDTLDKPIEIRPVAVEDLLGRPQNVLDREGLRRLIAGRRVLVTGAGGTIGSELVRQIAGLAPSFLTLLDNGEFNLYKIDLELSEAHPKLSRRAILADIRDAAGLTRILREMRPELVFHAAALKHVPLVELNACEGVLTNAIGSRNLADACREAGVAIMVQISTDKAVNPTNVMGASKRIAESYCQALDIQALEAQERGAHTVLPRTRFVTVRFGNVLGSTGSVVPLFQRQLAAGGPLTVTHPDVIRYFMTVREAVELVLQAAALDGGGDNAGKIFVLDMGEPVRIMDLARQMIRLAGKRPNIDIQIEITGLRPGEKLFEEIFHGAEPLLPTACQGILLAAPRAGDATALAAAIDNLAEICTRGDEAALQAQLHRLVPEYQAARLEAENIVRLARPQRG